MRANAAQRRALLAQLLAAMTASTCALPDVLFFIVDDSRTLSSDIRTPSIRNLASKGTLFDSAFAQQAVCAPSRNSLLTGRRPDTLHLYDFYSYWRDFSGNFTTLPQFFKEYGYRTLSFGKVFHPGKSSNFTDDYPYSWSERPFRPSAEAYKQSKVCVDEQTAKLQRNLVCPVDVKYQPEGTLPDIQTANAVIDKLKNVYKDENHDPFFMAVGFHKPHIPLKYPREYLDFYPIENISLPKMPFRPPLMPDVAWNPWLDIRDRQDIKRLNISIPFGIVPSEWSLKIKQSYYAAITYVDDLIGKILNHVDFENTIIVFTSDHGWSLGEHGEWSKYSNFDVATRVPLIIVAPDAAFSRNKIVKDVVELVDIFPTIAELSGITDAFPKCKKGQFQNLCSEGHSLRSLMLNSGISTQNRFALSQYPRPGKFPTISPNSDKPKLKQIKIMGYSIRTDRFRYTEWVRFDHTTFLPDWNKIFGKELYDHLIDDGENLNLADRRELSYIQNYLSSILRSAIS